MKSNIRHLCDFLDNLRSASDGSSKLEIKFHDNDEETRQWVLTYSSFADEYDVDAGEASKVGESIGSYSITIKYCPFCGALLDKK